MYHKKLQSLIEIHMQQEYSESAWEQRIALNKNDNNAGAR